MRREGFLGSPLGEQLAKGLAVASLMTGVGCATEIGEATHANLCDATTRAVAADNLGLPAGVIKTGDCFAAPDDGITIGQRLVVEANPERDIPQTFTIDASLSPPDEPVRPNGETFDDLQDAQVDDPCSIEVRGQDHDCVDLDTATIIDLPAGVLAVSVQPQEQAGIDMDPADQTAQRIQDDDLRRLARDIAEQLDQPVSTLAHQEPTERAESPLIAADQANTQNQPGTEDDEQVEPTQEAECQFHLNSNRRCESDNPVVEVGHWTFSEVSACTGLRPAIDWGDGQSEPIPLADDSLTHTYEEAGTYAIHAESAINNVGCYIPPLNVTFAYTGRGSAPAETDCEVLYDAHRARTYLLAMLPDGILRPVTTPDNEDEEKAITDYKTFKDDSGMEWRLVGLSGSLEHQPTGFSSVNPLDYPQPFLKFLSPIDSERGSFEVILMPDGATSDMTHAQIENLQVDGQYTYNEGNYLLTGVGMPTYNYADPLADKKGFIDHMLWDYWPHESDADYLPPDPDHILNPRANDEGWHTYRQRLFSAIRLLHSGHKLVYENGDYVLSRDGVQISVQEDIAWLVKQYSECSQSDFEPDQSLPFSVLHFG